MRRALLLFLMFAGFALIVWSGWQNLRQRERAAQSQQAARVDLIPDTPSPSADADNSPLRGKPAPAFTLLDLNGKKVSLSDFKGHPLVVNFWGTYCAPCKVEMPWLEEFSKKYATTASKSSASPTTPRSAKKPSARIRKNSASPTPSSSPTRPSRRPTSATPRSCPCPSTWTGPAK
jgi:hypothetical protein